MKQVYEIIFNFPGGGVGMTTFIASSETEARILFASHYEGCQIVSCKKL